MIIISDKPKEDVEIRNWEFRNPIELIQGIDDEMKNLESELGKGNHTVEHMYNVYYLCRCAIFMINSLILIIGKDINNVFKDKFDENLYI